MINVLPAVPAKDRTTSRAEPIRLNIGLQTEGMVITQSDERFCCESGKFCMDVLTLARASQDRVPTRPEAQYMCLIHADSGKNMLVAFTSIENVRTFIWEFRPRVVVVMVGDGENAERIADQLGPEQ